MTIHMTIDRQLGENERHLSVPINVELLPNPKLIIRRNNSTNGFEIDDITLQNLERRLEEDIEFRRNFTVDTSPIEEPLNRSLIINRNAGTVRRDL